MVNVFFALRASSACERTNTTAVCLMTTVLPITGYHNSAAAASAAAVGEQLDLLAGEDW